LHQSRHFTASIPFYDLVVTTKAFEVNLYEMAGAKRIVLVLQGYDERFSSVVPTAVDRAEFASDVCFIGHYERYYAHRLKAASRATKCLRIWGPRWKRYRWFHPWALRHVYGDGLWGKKYLLGLASSKIALGLLSKRIPEASTTRSFEIPATGVFMLAERTDEHLAYFTEGAEAEFFGCDQELTDKIRFYLRHDALRRRIAAAGRERCIRSNYHSRYQLGRVLQEAS
jgi:spore maturation protein CgeB